MTIVISSDAAISDTGRRQRLYAGGVFCFPPRSSALAVVDFAAEMIAEAFGGRDPLTAHHELPVEEYVDIIGPLKTRFTHHPRSMELLRELLVDLGADPTKTYVDVPRLRIGTPARYLCAGLGYSYTPHRDTWYSAPQCVNNWWVPIAGNSAATGMQFHPEYWQRRVDNTSAGFDAYEWNRTSRRDAASYITSDPRPHPKLRASGPGSSVQVVGAPGSILNFSGAQLHSSVPNETDGVRMSFDFRTAHIDDLMTHAGPKNVDSSCTGTSVRDYRRADTGKQLPDAVVRQYDRNGSKDGVLVFDPLALDSLSENGIGQGSR